MPKDQQGQVLALVVGAGLIALVLALNDHGPAPVPVVGDCSTCTYQLIPSPGCPSGCPAPGTCLTLG